MILFLGKYGKKHLHVHFCMQMLFFQIQLEKYDWRWWAYLPTQKIWNRLNCRLG